MTNDFINYGNLISLGMDCNKQLLTVMRNTKCVIKRGVFLTYQKEKSYRQYFNETHAWGLIKGNLMLI